MHTVVAATLRSGRGDLISEAFWFPDFNEVIRRRAATITAIARADADGGYELRVCSDVFLYAVRFDVTAWVPDDNYLCLMPGREQVVRFAPAHDAAGAFGGYVEALNGTEPVRIDVRNA
jgi:hypothetical protein